MSIRPSERKESNYSAVESPPSDLELKTKEAKNIFLFLLIFIGIDYILDLLIISKESNFFNDKENEIALFVIKLVCLTVFFLFVIISLSLFNVKLTKIVRYVYIIVLGLYFIFEVIWSIKEFVQHYSDSNWVDFLCFLLILLTLIPRIFFFYNADALIIKITEIDDCKSGEAHDKFRENLENKMERGEDTNWSKTSLPSERAQQSQFLSGNINKIKTNSESNVNTIKENYEGEQDNENDNNE